MGRQGIRLERGHGHAHNGAALHCMSEAPLEACDCLLNRGSLPLKPVSRWKMDITTQPERIAENEAPRPASVPQRCRFTHPPVNLTNKRALVRLWLSMHRKHSHALGRAPAAASRRAFPAEREPSPTSARSRCVSRACTHRRSASGLRLPSVPAYLESERHPIDGRASIRPAPLRLHPPR